MENNDFSVLIDPPREKHELNSMYKLELWRVSIPE